MLGEPGSSPFAERTPEPPPSWEEIEALGRSEAIRDRAFAFGALQIRFGHGDAADRERARDLLAATRERTRAIHAPLRSSIARGELRGTALRARIEACDEDVREHWIEEVLDIAHPPLDERRLPRDLVGYVPSGVGEILHVLDATRLGPDKTLVDLGCGMGKVLLLAALLVGARGHGIDLDAPLIERGRAAAKELGLAQVGFEHADVREADLDVGDVYFLYVPFTGAVLEQTMARLAPVASRRRVIVCSSALDLGRIDWLRKREEPSFWLDVYESAGA